MALYKGPEEAFAGVASRPGEPDVPAYFWEHLTSERDLTELLLQNVLIIKPVSRPWYWNQVRRRKIVAWEGCHAALLGVGALPGHPLVSVYSRKKMVEAFELIGGRRSGEALASDSVMDKVAEIWIKREMEAVRFTADRSPFYI